MLIMINYMLVYFNVLYFIRIFESVNIFEKETVLHLNIKIMT